MLTAPDSKAFPTFPSRESIVFYHNKFGRDTTLNLGPAGSIMMLLDTATWEGSLGKLTRVCIGPARATTCCSLAAPGIIVTGV